MKKINYALLIIILGLSHQVSAQDGMILPMPGMKPSSQTSTNSNKANTNTQRNERQGQTNNRNSKPNNYKDSSGAILPLPNLNNRAEPEPEQKQPKNETKNTRQPQKPVDNPHTEPLIAIPPMDNNSGRTQPPAIPDSPKTPEVVNVSKPADPMAEEVSDFLNEGNDFPIPSNEFTASVENSQVEDLLPAAGADTTVAKDASGGSITVYPKDTGAAIFMVMKSWQCEDYDAVGLINQALEVYGKDAGDTYQIDGLDNITNGLKVSVEEEDITFDELLDILASKTGNDWGCNIQSKTIYIYPKGIKTDSYVSWE